MWLLALNGIIWYIDFLCPPIQRWAPPCWGTRLQSSLGWSRPTAPSVRGRGTSSGLCWLLLSSTMIWKAWRWPWGTHWGNLPAECLPWRYSNSYLGCTICLRLRAQSCRLNTKFVFNLTIELSLCTTTWCDLLLMSLSGIQLAAVQCDPDHFSARHPLAFCSISHSIALWARGWGRWGEQGQQRNCGTGNEW